MEKVSLDGIDPGALGEGSERRGLSEPLGTTEVAINHYRLAPGDGFPGGLHAHADQEELFFVVEGEATFETTDGEVTVGESGAIRFAPGEFQSGWNRSEDDLVAFAMGAPRDSEDVRIPVACPDCGRGDVRLDADADGVALVCPDCGAEHVPRPCPDCGHGDLRATLGEGTRTVVACRGCGAEFEDAPLR